MHLIDRLLVNRVIRDQIYWHIEKKQSIIIRVRQAITSVRIYTIGRSSVVKFILKWSFPIMAGSNMTDTNCKNYNIILLFFLMRSVMKKEYLGNGKDTGTLGWSRACPLPLPTHYLFQGIRNQFWMIGLFSITGSPEFFRKRGPTSNYSHDTRSFSEWKLIFTYYHHREGSSSCSLLCSCNKVTCRWDRCHK